MATTMAWCVCAFCAFAPVAQECGLRGQQGKLGFKVATTPVIEMMSMVWNMCAARAYALWCKEVVVVVNKVRCIMVP